MNFKTFYKKMTLREKLLLTSFVWVILAVSFFYLIDWSKNNKHEWRKTASLLEAQEALFEQKPEIDSAIEDILKRFNPSKTFGSRKLVGHVDQLARNLGLIFDISGSPKRRSNDTLELHSLRGTIKRKEIEKLLEFEALLRAEFPYIIVESMRITANTSDPKQLDATFVINSFELK